MRKYLKYDVKSNMKFFLSTFICFVILLVSLVSVRTIGSFTSLLEVGSAINSIEIILIGVFIMTMIYFVINTFYKDLYTDRSILTFSLPISAREFLTAKLLVINIFFYLLVFLSIFLFYLSGRFMNIWSLISIIFAMIILNVFSLLIFLFMQMDRFLFKRKNTVIIIILLIGLIFVGGFFLNRYFLFLSDGSLVRSGDNTLAFISAYVKVSGRKLLNITGFLYYILTALILSFFNIKILKNDLDLS
ncbi:ABC transporter permease [Anaerococcus sp. AGMB00486]|uniref:ABC transporter permease n=3 Tax=Anaerococcus TaxID=165779 RepID=A0ABX2NBF6_9FIRM|nr:ABC transporter permease [Anaerococcus faecalis]MSS78140.1 ABC transporter permease [Anaerococcus porci]NVF12056.1 ABC transporter permease [Anaerococcus faecalis]